MPIFVTVAQFTRLRIEKQCENGTKQVKTGKNSTSGYAAKLNFELDRGIGDKVRHANFRDRSAICTRPRVVTDTHTDVRLYIKDFSINFVCSKSMMCSSGQVKENTSLTIN